MTAANDRIEVERAVAVALQAYDLTGEIRTVVQGVNWTLAAGPVEAPVAYVRLYRQVGRPTDAIAAELAVLDAVVASDRLDVARAVADRRGGFLAQLQMAGGGVRPMAVFHPAQGEPVHERPEDLQAAGAALAELHAQSRLASLAPRRELATGAEVDATIAQVGSRWQEDRDRLGAAIAELRGQGANRATGPAGFCHGDFRLANLRRQGDRIVMFDFDDCGRGPQWLDLATIAWWLELAAGDDAAELWQAFLAGYGQGRGTAEQRDALRWLVAVQHLRSLRFLQDYCQLDDATWTEAIDGAAEMVERAARGDLRFLGEA